MVISEARPRPHLGHPSRPPYIFREGWQAPLISCKGCERMYLMPGVAYWRCLKHGMFYKVKPSWALALERIRVN